MVTTDSHQGRTVCPNLARQMTLSGKDQLCVVVYHLRPPAGGVRVRGCASRRLIAPSDRLGAGSYHVSGHEDIRLVQVLPQLLDRRLRDHFVRALMIEFDHAAEPDRFGVALLMRLAERVLEDDLPVERPAAFPKGRGRDLEHPTSPDQLKSHGITAIADVVRGHRVAQGMDAVLDGADAEDVAEFEEVVESVPFVYKPAITLPKILSSTGSGFFCKWRHSSLEEVAKIFVSSRCLPKLLHSLTRLALGEPS